VSSKKKTQRKKNPSKNLPRRQAGRRPLRRTRQNAKFLAQKRTVKRKPAKHTLPSMQELRIAAIEGAAVLEKQAEFQEKIFQQINENAEFRDLIIDSTIRKLFSR